MKPAYSVLIFTLLSGAGYGLFPLLVLTHLSGVEGVGSAQVLVGGGLSLVLMTVGLVASILDLTNPKNAWRAFSRFKTSWPSREGVFAILVYPFALAYLLGVWVARDQGGMLTPFLGILAAVLAMVTLFCTSMIYASLKTIRQWSNALTSLSYLSLKLMAGSLILAVLVSVSQGKASIALTILSLGLIVLAGVVKLLYFFVIDKPSGSTINPASGFTQATVRLLETGHWTDTLLTREFCDRDKLLDVRTWMLLLAFLAPGLILVQGVLFGDSIYFASITPVLMLAGVFLERWLFFAEARHAVGLYHGDRGA